MALTPVSRSLLRSPGGKSLHGDFCYAIIYLDAENLCEK
jgi:hypothetical protein